MPDTFDIFRFRWLGHENAVAIATGCSFICRPVLVPTEWYREGRGTGISCQHRREDPLALPLQASGRRASESFQKHIFCPLRDGTYTR